MVVGWSVGGLGEHVRFYQTSLGSICLPVYSHLSKADDSNTFKLQKGERKTLFHVSGISRGCGLGFWLLSSEKLSNNFHYHACYVCNYRISQWALFPSRNLKNLEL